jgi:hypothetical protein
MSHLERLGNEIGVPIKPDHDGYVGRECPEKKCLGYFKITLGTGLKGKNLPCNCPYCGHTDSHNHFWTPEQLEYAKSVAFNKITEAVMTDLRELEFDHPPTGPFGIGMSLTVEGTAHPVSYYREKRLETEVVCQQCTLRYAIFGVFGYCPDCGVHNSLQILNKNLDLVEKMLVLAETAEPELANHLIGIALADSVSAMDGFGRESCRVAFSAQSKVMPDNFSFQRLEGAQKNVQTHFGYALASSLEPAEWEMACRCFQKRHLLAHNMGVVDVKYACSTNDREAVIGRKIRVSPEEVRSLVTILRKMGAALVDGINAQET